MAVFIDKSLFLGVTMSKWDDYKKTYRVDTTLIDCARSGDFYSLVNLLSNNPDININETNSSGYSALMLAVYNNEKDCCEALLRCGADVNSTDHVGNTVLMASAYKGNLEIFKLLLEFGSNPQLTNKTNMTARDWALMFNRKAIIDYLNTTHPGKTDHKFKSIVKFIALSSMMAIKRLVSVS